MSVVRELIVFLVALLLAVSAASSASTTTSNQQPAQGGVRPEYGWPRPPYRPTPTPTPSPPPSRPPPTDPWWCNRTYGEESVSLSETDDVDCPPPPAPPTSSCPWPCVCPPCRPSSVVGSPDDDECLAPLAAVRSCEGFLTGAEDDTPSTTSACCTGMRSVVDRTSSTAAGGGDGFIHRCLCPVVLGDMDMDRLLPTPVDPLRLMYLPVACGFLLPPQLLYICYSGRASAPLVSSFSELGH